VKEAVEEETHPFFPYFTVEVEVEVEVVGITMGIIGSSVRYQKRNSMPPCSLHDCMSYATLDATESTPFGPESITLWH
jgi:hypothetical protein